MWTFFNKKKALYMSIVIGLLLLLLPISTKADTVERISGAMTKTEYKQQFSQLNEQQNEIWNSTYNFKPETNVKRVSEWKDFKAAFENNDVSKIILEKNITASVTNVAYNRTESLEIDGQGYKLEMVNSSLNFDDLAKPSDFTKKFSDTPVFHMHDIEIVNNTGVGAVEGNLGTAWAFINGRGQFGPGGAAGGRRGLWRYRIGNVITPYDENKKTNNQRVGGRLINAELGEVSIWGYNKIVTGAENFYTGGITYEPYTYYRGEIAYYNYSTIWFMLNPAQVDNSNVNKKNLTGTQKFDIGANSFVYLHNTNTGTGFPAVYEHYQLLNVGENATYNANVPGTAVSFNETNAKFVAEKNAKVNLLSRSSGAPTISLINSNNTHGTGSTIPPLNTSYTINENAEFYVVGNTGNANNGITQFGNSSANNGKIYLNSVESFDIRNQSNSNFMGIGTANSLFNIVNSDISVWKNASSVDGIPDIDSANVTNFSVVPTGVNGVVTSTDPTLNSDFKRTQYKRISGLNSTPQLIWEPVTDADYTQKAQILLGYVPLGGSDPFDENGDPKVIPVYADARRVAQSDFTDTLGNKYTSKSQADKFLYWRKDDHEKAGYQIAGQEISGVPFRVDGNNQRYRDGEKTSTVVIDATPPSPAKVDTVVTTVSKKITGTGEPDSKVTVTINDVKQNDMSSIVDSQGNWEIAIPDKRLKNKDKVQIFLEDNALEIVSDKKIAEENQLVYLPADRIPPTNSATGNINPKEDVHYSDAIFKAATIVTVKEVEPPTPKITKIARALTIDDKGNQIPQGDGTPIKPEDWKGKITKVNNTLSYRIVVQIPGEKGKESQRVLYNAQITDKIPEHLTFDPQNVNVWKYEKGDIYEGLPFRYLDNVIDGSGKHQFNMGDIDLVTSEATPIVDPIVEYDETNRLLRVGIGDRSKNVNDKYSEFGYEGSNKYGHLLPGDKIVIEFPTTITADAVKSTIKNTGIITGYSAEEISTDPVEYKKIEVTSNEALNPGGDVIGELLLVSAPEKIHFGSHKLRDYDKEVGSTIDNQLIVKDSMKTDDWKVSVRLVSEMANMSDPNNLKLKDSLYIKTKSMTKKMLITTSPIDIYKSDISNTPSTVEEFNVSEDWDIDGDYGIKLKAGNIPSKGTYKGTVEWALTNTQ